MASKYGRQLYGLDLYSDAHLDLEGSLSFVPALSGRLQEYEFLEGTLSFVPVLTGRAYRSQLIESDLDISVVLDAILQENNGFRGSLSVIPTYNAELSRPSSRPLEASWVIPVIIDGNRLGVERPLESQIDVLVNIPDSGNIYIGPFWDPDEPQDGPWNPDIPEDGPWVANVETDNPWSPVS